MNIRPLLAPAGGLRLSAQGSWYSTPLVNTDFNSPVAHCREDLSENNAPTAQQASIPMYLKDTSNTLSHVRLKPGCNKLDSLASHIRFYLKMFSGLRRPRKNLSCSFCVFKDFLPNVELSTIVQTNQHASSSIHRFASVKRL